MPFDFLEPPEGREAEYRSVFIDYYIGTKGVRRMVWTPGLKGLLLDDFDDETVFGRSVKIGEMSSLLVYILNRDDDARQMMDDALRAHDIDRAENVARLALASFAPETPNDIYQVENCRSCRISITGFYRYAFSRYVGDALANRCRAEHFREYLRRSLREHIDDFESEQVSREIEEIHRSAIDRSYRFGGTFGVDLGTVNRNLQVSRKDVLTPAFAVASTGALLPLGGSRGDY